MVTFDIGSGQTVPGVVVYGSYTVPRWPKPAVGLKASEEKTEVRTTDEAGQTTLERAKARSLIIFRVEKAGYKWQQPRQKSESRKIEVYPKWPILPSAPLVRAYGSGTADDPYKLEMVPVE